MNKLIHNFRLLLLVSLMSISLLGVQLVQGSALHDHEHHTVDCALCHFQLSDDSIVGHAAQLPGHFFTYSSCHPEQFKADSRSSSPYQSRAPPYRTL